MNLLTKGILAASVLIGAANIGHNIPISADSKANFHEYNSKGISSNLDISQGWTNVNYNSDIQPDVNQVFLQNQEIMGNQKGVLVQAGNLGDSSFTAQKIIHMKEGHRYVLDLIYAQYYNGQGSGYIDFNGEKIVSNGNHEDQHYKKTITPPKDMDYTITVSFTTIYPGNAYFKIAYDKSSGGISDTPVKLEAPIVSPSPEAGTNEVSGKAYKGNTIVVSDEKGDIGTGTVADDGTFHVKTSRALKYKETLKVVQKNDQDTSPATMVNVADTKDPKPPIISQITDEEKEVSGTSEPYTTVYITFDTGLLSLPTYSGVTDKDGKFKITLDQTYLGNTKFSAKAIDEAGHESKETSGKVEFAKKLELTLNHHISSADTLVSGKTSRPNCKVTAHFGNRIYTSQSDDKGNFHISIDKHTPATKYIIDAIDPRDPDNPVSTNDVVLPRIPNMSSMEAGIKVLKGIVDPGAEVSLTLTRGKDSFKYQATADDQGQFNIPLKDKDGKDLILSIGDQLTYSAKLSVDGKDLSSEEGQSTIYTF